MAAAHLERLLDDLQMRTARGKPPKDTEWDVLFAAAQRYNVGKPSLRLVSLLREIANLEAGHTARRARERRVHAQVGDCMTWTLIVVLVAVMVVFLCTAPFMPHRTK